ncbi:PhoX family protein [Haloferax profundi]|uniref:Cell surface protein n=1 Tax=Haloferax profundi TaxID=1544718 RepID=A0A0W1SVJ9_9EURY|nr:alkaline phosphatase PhoX [Haloferax profundi]KTG30491.1 hypothetical protein AUR66_07570 [Haloferax profundi]
MREKFTRRAFVATAVAASLAGCGGTSPSTSTRETATETTATPRPPREPSLRRLATNVTGAEFTGLFLSDDGHFFFNVQHPDHGNDPPFATGAVGVVTKYDMNSLPFDFESVSVPDDPSKSVETAVGEYKVLANGGDEIGDARALGVPFSPDGEPLTSAINPDFNGFIPVSDTEGYLFTDWEDHPGMVSRLHLEDPSGERDWEVVDGMNLDFEPVEGTWFNCFGTVSPWGTPLSSEELMFADTREWNNPSFETIDDVENLAKYLGYYPNPYRYGYIVEITDPKADSPTPVKHFSMGRFAHENAVVMPDERTVYLTDDEVATAFFKFIADEPGDLSAGTLFAAAVTQDDSRDVATTGFDIEWVRLAHGTNDQIEAWIAEYDGITQDDYADEENSYITDAEIQAWADGDASDDRVAFLESRKAAGALGATVEFRKMEGVNARAGVEPGEYAYVAMAEINEAMVDGRDHIDVEQNDYGAVYRMQLGDDYDVNRMEPALVGGPSGLVCESCSTDDGDDSHVLSNPDNLVVMPDGRVIVGEDSGLRQPSMLWLFDPGTE